MGGLWIGRYGVRPGMASSNMLAGSSIIDCVKNIHVAQLSRKLDACLFVTRTENECVTMANENVSRDAVMAAAGGLKLISLGRH